VSPAVSIRFSEHGYVRAVFNRVISYDKPDADVLLLGIGYRRE
jgi:hypothetical protein